MRCDRCHRNQAEIRIEQGIGGGKRVYNLCGECARELGWVPGNPVFEQLLHANGMPLGAMVTQFLHQLGSPETEVCPVCGQTYDDFRQSSLLGCETCYQAFGPRLDNLIKRVQAGDRHVGRRPGQAAGQPGEQAEARENQAGRSGQETDPTRAAGLDKTVPELRKLLKAAVDREDYEEAAILRDQIKRLTVPEQEDGAKQTAKKARKKTTEPMTQRAAAAADDKSAGDGAANADDKSTEKQGQRRGKKQLDAKQPSKKNKSQDPDGKEQP